MHDTTDTRILLVTQYDGAAFSGWQRQPKVRTVQGEMEKVLLGLCSRETNAIAAGRTDAGVHALGQGVGIKVRPRWTAETIRRALNAKLPSDIWIAQSFAMTSDFHPRFSAYRRRYSYRVGTDMYARSPFRRHTEWAISGVPDMNLLENESQALLGNHSFRAFAIKGTAPATDDHRCEIYLARWTARDGGITFEIEGNRFLHHMVRFLVGTMMEVGLGKRESGAISSLLKMGDNSGTAAPAPPQGLFLERVSYPETLYLSQS